MLHPSYDVVFLEPDHELGWKQVPGHEYTWAGRGWYAREFSARTHVNSRGFRDYEREVAKPDGLRRVALLGDSFVEALQVPLEKTAGQLLEARLNREDPPWEVLNFGISNYGVGQYLLVWESHVHEFAPDFVFVFVADSQIRRTVQGFESGAFLSTRGRRLWVRPTFRLRGGQLVRERARDFEEFVRVQEKLIQSEFNGERSRIRERSLLGHYLKVWFPDRSKKPRGGGGSRHSDKALTLRVNLEVLQELARKTRLVGSYLVVVDASRYLWFGSDLAQSLKAFCAREELGYIPLWTALNQARRSGSAMRWRYDRHFSEAAHEVFASALHSWLVSRELGSARGYRAPAWVPSGSASSAVSTAAVRPRAAGLSLKAEFMHRGMPSAINNKPDSC